MRRVYLAIITILVLIIVAIGIALFNFVKDSNKNAIDNSERIDNYIDSIIDNTNDGQNEISNSENSNVDTNENGNIKVNFTDNTVLAIGLVTDENEQEFVNTYFKDAYQYKYYKSYDFRSDYDQKGNKFVIIPKNDSIKAILYACEYDEDGNLMIKNNLIDLESKGPYIIRADDTEYLPRICLGLNYNGFEEYIPISFSGKNGHLDLKGYESEVIDISMYDSENEE